MIMCYWFEPVLYSDPFAKLPETTEKPGCFFGFFADNVGDVLTFKILKNDWSTLLHRIVVTSAVGVTHRNKHVAFKPDIQETLDKLDAKPSAIIPRDSHPKQSLVMKFPIKVDPRQVTLTRVLVAWQDLKYMLCYIQTFKVTSSNCIMQSGFNIRVMATI